MKVQRKWRSILQMKSRWQKVFTCYLLAGSMDGYGEFVDYALDTHRTLQQNLTRFFVEWFAKAEKGSAFLKRAKMVYSRYSLPYI